MATDPSQFVPLTTAEFQILLALADGERHGYALMQEIADATQGKVKLGPGTLYRSIKRLLANGLISECGDRPDPAMDDERRRYYQLSELGRRVAAAEAARLDALVAQAYARLGLRAPSAERMGQA